MITVELNKEQLQELSYALSYLQSAHEQLSKVLNLQVLSELNEACEKLRSGVKPINEEYNRVIDAKMNMFDEYREKANFKSVWSIYDINSLSDNSGLQGEKLIYQEHWGEKPVEINLPSGELTWAALWRTAELAIIQSGDVHHIFIESFKSINGNLYLRTGS